MKILATIPILLFTFSTFAQGPFQIISWVGGYLADDQEARYYNVDFKSDPYDKKSVDSPDITNWIEFDIQDMDVENFDMIWDRRLGEENSVTNSVGGIMAISNPETFGTTFKVCHNSEYLYVFLKSVDFESLTEPGERAFEIMLQTKEPDRYEEGIEAAVSRFGLVGSNAQYGRFIELGGAKYAIKNGEVINNTTNGGQDGSWKSALGDFNNTECFWHEDEQGTIRCILALSFENDLIYMDDEWGAYDETNYVSLDPKVKPKISFDVFFMNKLDGNSPKFCWSGDTNDTYAFIYFAGYLNFKNNFLLPVEGDVEIDTIIINDTVYINKTIRVHDTVYIVETVFENCQTDTLTINAALSLGEPEDFDLIYIYPNPTEDRITIEAQDYLWFSDCTLKIVNIYGQVVFSQKCTQPVFDIDLKGFGTSGTYFLQFLSQENVILDSKVIILR